MKKHGSSINLRPLAEKILQEYIKYFFKQNGVMPEKVNFDGKNKKYDVKFKFPISTKTMYENSTGANHIIIKNMVANIQNAKHGETVKLLQTKFVTKTSDYLLQYKNIKKNIESDKLPQAINLVLSKEDLLLTDINLSFLNEDSSNEASFVEEENSVGIEFFVPKAMSFQSFNKELLLPTIEHELIHLFQFIVSERFLRDLFTTVIADNHHTKIKNYDKSNNRDDYYDSWQEVVPWIVDLSRQLSFVLKNKSKEDKEMLVDKIFDVIQHKIPIIDNGDTIIKYAKAFSKKYFEGLYFEPLYVILSFPYHERSPDIFKEQKKRIKTRVLSE